MDRRKDRWDCGSHNNLSAGSGKDAIAVVGRELGSGGEADMSHVLEHRCGGEQVLHLPLHSSHHRNRRNESSFQGTGTHTDRCRSVPVSMTGLLRHET